MMGNMVTIGQAMLIGAATGTATTLLWIVLIWLAAKLAGKWWET